MICILDPGATRAQTVRIPNQPQEVRRLVKKIVKRAPGAVRMGYEAGAQCVVVAPALIPVKAGERVKTDRRDAYKLAVYLQAGLLTEVAHGTQRLARLDQRLEALAREAPYAESRELAGFLWSVVYVQAEEVHSGRENDPGRGRPVDCAAAAGA